MSTNVVGNILAEYKVASCEFENFCRMNRIQFEFLLSKVAPFLEKQNTILRNSIPPVERLLVTLRFFATGI